MADYSGLPDGRTGRTRLERLGCGLGCIGFIVAVAGVLALAAALIWLLSASDGD